MPPPDDVPAAVAASAAGAPWVALGRRGDGAPHVFGFRDGRGRSLVAKRAHGEIAVERLADEGARLAWLDGQWPAPELVAFEPGRDSAGGPTAWLVTVAHRGASGDELHHRVDGPGLARAFAVGLRAVHELDVASCPFDERLTIRRQAAEQRVRDGLVDADRFDEAYRRYDPDQLLAVWRASEPAESEDLVVVHGDYALDNVLLDAGEISGIVDWGRCGVADRYVDLAAAARSLAAAVGPELVIAFFDEYGVEHPSLAKIDFYALGAELLR